MKSSKIPRKYQLPINFLDQEKTIFPISENFKTRTFPYSKNIVFHAEENVILHQLFESKEDRISHLQKVHSKNPSVFRKHVFNAVFNIILQQLFESKEDRISHLRKVQNKNFSLIKKHSIPC